MSELITQPVRARRVRNQLNWLIIPFGFALLIAIVVTEIKLTSSNAASVLTATGPLKPLRQPAFTTDYPAGWSFKVANNGSFGRSYQFGSDQSTPDSFGIPAPGEVGLSISDAPVSVVEAVSGDQSSAPKPVLAAAVGLPQAITDLRVQTPAHAIHLDGDAGEAITDTYDYASVPNVQTDVAVRHGNAVIVLETDSDPAASGAATAVLAQAMAHWHWLSQTVRYPTPSRQDRTEITAALTTLFSALRAEDFAAACVVYDATARALIARAVAAMGDGTHGGCPDELLELLSSSNALSRSADLGTPHITDIAVQGNLAIATYTSSIDGLTAHSSSVMHRQHGRWQVQTATSLTFTRGQATTGA